MPRNLHHNRHHKLITLYFNAHFLQQLRGKFVHSHIFEAFNPQSHALGFDLNFVIQG